MAMAFYLANIPGGWKIFHEISRVPRPSGGEFLGIAVPRGKNSLFLQTGEFF
jgi:hypothetical protein